MSSREILFSGSSRVDARALPADIADVSHFVHADNPMDSEAASRGTTVYLVDKRIDMLPSLLGTNLCSLRPYVERLAFSTIWVSFVTGVVTEGKANISGSGRK